MDGASTADKITKNSRKKKPWQRKKKRKKRREKNPESRGGEKTELKKKNKNGKSRQQKEREEKNDGKNKKGKPRRARKTELASNVFYGLTHSWATTPNTGPCTYSTSQAAIRADRPVE